MVATAFVVPALNSAKWEDRDATKTKARHVHRDQKPNADHSSAAAAQTNTNAITPRLAQIKALT